MNLGFSLFKVPAYIGYGSIPKKIKLIEVVIKQIANETSLALDEKILKVIYLALMGKSKSI